MEKKKWTEYLLEFFMLFLAVYLGFVAENIRERSHDKEKAKDYIRSLYEDLKSDTANLSELINYDKKKIAALIKIQSCFNLVSINRENTSCMFELVKNSKTNRNFQITDRALRQLSNTGGFRLLDKDDVDSIITYENLYKNYQNYESTVFQEAQNNIRNTWNMLVDFNINLKLPGTNPLFEKRYLAALTQDSVSVNTESTLLFSNDKNLFNKYFNELVLYLRVTLGQQIFLEELKGRATVLIEFYGKKVN